MSEKSMFTPGPWDVDEGDASVYAIDDDGGIIPLFQPHDDGVSLSQTFCNASLAAAGPDLFEVAQMVVRASEMAGISGPLADAARAAIRKAISE